MIPFLAPIASRAASAFISNTARGLNSGQSLKDAAKGALRPTAEGAVEAVAEEVGKDSCSVDMVIRERRYIRE